jgi:SAM-dependent methyltransferase
MESLKALIPPGIRRALSPVARACRHAYTGVRRPMQRLFRRHVPPSRAAGLDEEIDFWRNWFATKGAEWPEDYKTRLDPQSSLEDNIRQFIDPLEADTVRILDVGAGPLTLIGKQHPSKKISIVATDALADRYDSLLDEFGVTPIVRTELVDAEALSQRFGESAFDFVLAQNCVDHMANPLAAIEQMLLVAKPGCTVLLSHEENEAEKQAYEGLHQWNLTCEGDDFVIRDAHGRQTNVGDVFEQVAEFDCSVEKGWVTVSARKKSVAL